MTLKIPQNKIKLGKNKQAKILDQFVTQTWTIFESKPTKSWTNFRFYTIHIYIYTYIYIYIYNRCCHEIGGRPLPTGTRGSFLTPKMCENDYCSSVLDQFGPFGPNPRPTPSEAPIQEPKTPQSDFQPRIGARTSLREIHVGI